MKALEFLMSRPVFIEINQDSLKALDGDAGVDLALERDESGRLTSACCAQLVLRLREFLGGQGWLARRRAFCAIASRGVTLRRLTVPSAAHQDVEQLLALQIESEFPLSPNELAWGYQAFSSEPAARNGSASAREMVVVALKKEVIAEYTALLSECGLSPVFTLGALARSSNLSSPPESGAFLDIGPGQSELIAFEEGAPQSVRVIPWGEESVTRSLESNLGVGREEAERLRTESGEASHLKDDLVLKVEQSIRAEIESLAGWIGRSWKGKKLYLTGKSLGIRQLAPNLSRALGGIECERVDSLTGQGRSAAIDGLRKSLERNGAPPLLTIEIRERKTSARSTQPAEWRWAALAVAFALGCFGLFYLDPIIGKARLSRRVAELKVYKEKLPEIDRELSFLQYLSSNQPPYLDAMFVLANAASPGTRIDSLSLNRRGDIALRATMQNMQPTEFRSKLVDSGFFSSVVLDEATPTPDRQRVVVRMSAQWKPPGQRPALPATPTTAKDAKDGKPTSPALGGPARPSAPETARPSASSAPAPTSPK